MNVANVLKWCQVLESGELKQTTGWMRKVVKEDCNGVEYGYCCLGVASFCVFPPADPLAEFAPNSAIWRNPLETCIMPVFTAEKLGVAPQQSVLAGYNDAGTTFAVMAALIRRDVELYISGKPTGVLFLNNGDRYNG